MITEIIVGVYALAQLMGTVYLAAKLRRVEHMLGNGTPGVFIRRAEVKLMNEKRDSDHSSVERRLDKLESWREKAWRESGIQP